MALDEYSCSAMKRACKEVIEKRDLIVVTHVNVLKISQNLHATFEFSTMTS